MGLIFFKKYQKRLIFFMFVLCISFYFKNLESKCYNPHFSKSALKLISDDHQKASRDDFDYFGLVKINYFDEPGEISSQFDAWL